MARKRKKRGVRVLALILVAAAVLGGFWYLRRCAPVDYKELADKYAGIYGVRKSLVYALIQTESGNDPGAVSSAGAVGLTQITPETFEWLCLKTGETHAVSDLNDPETSVKYGVFFLSLLLKEFDGERETAIAAYNAGMNAVRGWLTDPRYSSDGRTLKNIPYSETRWYVIKFKCYDILYRILY